MSSAKTRAAQEVANSRDKAAESFLVSGSTNQKLFAKTFVRNKSEAPATHPRRSISLIPRPLPIP